MSFQTIKDFLRPYDLMMLHWINQDMAHPLIDPFMQILSGPEIWVIGPLALLGWAFFEKDMRAFKFFLLLGVLAGIADSVTYYWLKESFQRLRPCRVLDTIRVLDGCSGALSFPSNHATNAMVIATTVAHYAKPWVGRMFLIGAVLLGASRVYVGVHYPFDVMFGFLWGALIGWLGCMIAKKYWLKPSWD